MIVLVAVLAAKVHLETVVGGLDDVDREFPSAMQQIAAAESTMRDCSATIVVGLFVHPPVLHPVEIVFDLGEILRPTIRRMAPTARKRQRRCCTVQVRKQAWRAHLRGVQFGIPAYKGRLRGLHH